MRLPGTLLLVVLLLQGVTPARADSLSSIFDQMIRFRGGLVNFPAVRREIERVVVSFELNAVRTADFVSTATTPGFVYAYDPETGVFTRTESALGPAYVEPAETVGRHGINLIGAYQYANFTELDGESLEASLDALRGAQGTDFLDVRTRKLAFRSQVFSVSGTYGITDRWDVNLLLPVFLSTLQLNGTSVLLVPGAAPFRNTVVARDTALGLGDALLRTKYRLPDRLGLALAAVLTLRVPTGNPDDFQGLGDVTVTPTFVAQRAFGPHVVRANLGVEFNAGDVQQTRIRYALGASLRVLTRLSVLLQFIGTSGLVDDDFTERDVSGTIPRSDIIDGGAGLEVALTPSVFAYVGALVPLTDDGLRAPVVPTGRIAARF